MSGDRQKVIVLTGASGGIGQALAREFAGTGTYFALIARDEARLEAALKGKGAGGRTLRERLVAEDRAKRRDQKPEVVVFPYLVVMVRFFIKVFTVSD